MKEFWKLYFTENKRFLLILLIFLISFLAYIRLPDYKVRNSTIRSSNGYVETTLAIDVFHNFYNPYLYQIIAREHNSINKKPNILTMQLHFLNYNYRTVVFDYDRGIQYVLIDYS